VSSTLRGAPAAHGNDVHFMSARNRPLRGVGPVGLAECDLSLVLGAANTRRPKQLEIGGGRPRAVAPHFLEQGSRSESSKLCLNYVPAVRNSASPL